MAMTMMMMTMMVVMMNVELAQIIFDERRYCTVLVFSQVLDQQHQQH